MPEWVWGIMLFVGASLAYWAGVALGRSDSAPNAKAWSEVRRYAIDMNKECALREMELNHEESMELIKRGAFDPMKDEEEEDEEDDD